MCRRQIGAGVALALVAVGCGGSDWAIREPTANYLPWGLKQAPTPVLTEPDHDADGVLNNADRCPDLPEDIDHFRDADGCPDPDNDGDGIPDAKDTRSDPSARSVGRHLLGAQER